MKRFELEKILLRFKEAKVAVLGDIMLDEFYWGKVDRISPEAPVPVVQVNKETWRPGGAANVASNLVALGAKAFIFGVVGDDGAGRRLTEEIQNEKINTEGLIVDSGRRTSVKTRIIGQKQQMIRIDRENTEIIDLERQRDIINSLCAMCEKLDGVIVSDYAKGVINKDLLEEITGHFKRHHKFVAIDPKLKNFAIYKNPTVITPNTKEAESTLGRVFETDEDVLKGGQDLLKNTGADSILITRSEQGLTLFQKHKGPVTIPTRALDVYDVTGAGDTVIAAFSMALAVGCSKEEAAEISNLAAGVVVGLIGTATASQAMVLDHYDRIHFKKESENS
jgi:D-beta-D-heptose 7-phosphate kinase/D-beta-D-heptose 1-phosphate adenosyltransferase